MTLISNVGNSVCVAMWSKFFLPAAMNTPFVWNFSVMRLTASVRLKVWQDAISARLSTLFFSRRLTLWPMKSIWKKPSRILWKKWKLRLSNLKLRVSSSRLNVSAKGQNTILKCFERWATPMVLKTTHATWMDVKKVSHPSPCLISSQKISLSWLMKVTWPWVRLRECITGTRPVRRCWLITVSVCHQRLITVHFDVKNLRVMFIRLSMCLPLQGTMRWSKLRLSLSKSSVRQGFLIQKSKCVQLWDKWMTSLVKSMPELKKASVSS